MPKGQLSRPYTRAVKSKKPRGIARAGQQVAEDYNAKRRKANAKRAAKGKQPTYMSRSRETPGTKGTKSGGKALKKIVHRMLKKRVVKDSTRGRGKKG